MKINETTTGEAGVSGIAAGHGDKPVGQVTWQRPGVTREDRERKNGHSGRVLWFTGLPGSGKSTLAFSLERELHARGIACYVLDGDNVRHGLCRDLGFSEADRRENLRRVGEVSKLFVDAGIVVLAALVSPNAEDRQMVRNLFEEGDFAEVYVRCSLEECERRDPKGLYKKARSGLIPSFTGIGAPYDVPERPELTIDTQTESANESVAALIEYLEARGDLLGRLAEAGQV
ncbi:adenylyl-sulfate kinase [Cohnella hashimotonis]|uniref:Adenylyl-sulfate kinase n=1 Tax=Cohnella hashimotonis TaxID=2826895 RepID=A0ABT6TJB9_9BACL|nr:adenylyl-sulfate kinase [Cohnella hashimotonis]MDI4646933.1 adenylyl-sulfate kinase [Cohnella hashimotonis]